MYPLKQMKRGRPLLLACLLAASSAYATSPPTITSGPKELSPNSFFVLGGSNFGPVAGTISVTFPAQAKTVTVPIGAPASNWWFGVGTGGTLPNVEAVSDQNVTITLTTKDGGKATWQAHFTPRMEIKALTLSDKQVKLVNCSTDGVANFCSAGAIAFKDPGSCAHIGVGVDTFGLGMPEGAFSGHHHGCWGLNIDAGVDTYSLSLQNGWKINSFDLAPSVDNGAVTLFGGVKFIGLGAGSYPIQWSIGKNGGDVVYAAAITIKGPKGLAF